LFALASVLCDFALNITTLIVSRFVQGFTDAAGVVLSRAVVRDIFSGKALIIFFALFMFIDAVAPMMATITGGTILLFEFTNWQSIFFFLAFIGVLIVVIIALMLKETLPPENRTPSSLGATVMTMGNLLKDRSFIGYALVVGFVHGGSF